MYWEAPYFISYLDLLSLLEAQRPNHEFPALTRYTCHEAGEAPICCTPTSPQHDRFHLPAGSTCYSNKPIRSAYQNQSLPPTPSLLQSVTSESPACSVCSSVQPPHGPAQHAASYPWVVQTWDLLTTIVLLRPAINCCGLHHLLAFRARDPSLTNGGE